MISYYIISHKLGVFLLKKEIFTACDGQNREKYGEIKYRF